MRSLWFGLVSLVLAWAGHAPAMEISHPSNTTATVAHNPQKQTFWQCLRGYVLKPLTWVKALPKRPLEFGITTIFTVVLILWLVSWLLPSPLDIIITVLVLVVALIFILWYWI